ncbi:MAG: HD domain-containing phosphohydrolase [Actinomycetota bacterium]
MPSSFPRKAKAYTISVAAVACAFLAPLMVRQPPTSLAIVAGFGALILVSEAFPTRSPGGAYYSVSFVVAVAALIAEGPATVALAALTSGLAIGFKARHAIWYVIFESAQLSLASGLAALAFIAGGGKVGALSTHSFPGILLPIVVATVVAFLVNSGLVATHVALVKGRSVVRVWRSSFGWTISSYFGYAPLGILLAGVYLEIGFAAIAFLVVPLLVARTAFASYMQMREVFDATTRGIVAAVEAKDPYTRGHSERVALLAEMMGLEMGMADPRLQALKYAALLHDVGKLAVPKHVLNKPDRLDEEEYGMIKEHPARSSDVLGEIDFLKEAAVAVYHHHERCDGEGYPSGLTNSEIPLYARVISVCDAFDSMTSQRAYRRSMSVEAAVAELRRCCGTQFDPDIVATFERVIEKRGQAICSEIEEAVDTGFAEALPEEASPEVSTSAAFA